MHTLLKQNTGASTDSTENLRKKRSPSCLLGVEVEFKHFVFRPRQLDLTELHCQNLVLIAVANEARPAATHPTINLLKLFYFNHIVMYYDDCFLFFFLPSMCFLFFFYGVCLKMFCMSSYCDVLYIRHYFQRTSC